jgi:hypothetical protein
MNGRVYGMRVRDVIDECGAGVVHAVKNFLVPILPGRNSGGGLRNEEVDLLAVVE